MKKGMQSLEQRPNLLSQIWNLEIRYTPFLKNVISFSELKRAIGANSRTLSDKLESLNRHGYTDRTVKTGPPLRVEYVLTPRRKNTVLLALPLLYYSSDLTSL